MPVSDTTAGVLWRLDPDEPLLRALAESAPDNPFRTPAFARAKALRGARAVVFFAPGETPPRGCAGFLNEGRVHRLLEIPSAPEAGPGHPLWAAIRGFSRDQGVTRLRIDSFGSAGGTIPVIGRERARRARREFRLCLGPDGGEGTLSSNHRRNLRRAERAGIRVEEAVGAVAEHQHAALIDLSMSRRRSRGEDAATGTGAHEFGHLLATGAGVLFQAAVPGGPVLSSVLVLLAARGGYYHSAGTSPEGMARGASQLLISTVAARLAERGMTLFNLGGAAEDQPGLARFKSGFGPQPVALEAASFDVATGSRRALVSVTEGLRSGLGRWRRSLGGCTGGGGKNAGAQGRVRYRD